MPPLSRTSITKSVSIMLPTYVLVDLYVGLVWIFQSPKRTSPPLDAIRKTWPVPYTGVFLLGIAILLFLALIAGDRKFAIFALLTNVVTWTTLGIVFALGLADDAHASLSGPILPIGWAIASLASSVGLLWNDARATDGAR